MGDGEYQTVTCKTCLTEFTTFEPKTLPMDCDCGKIYCDVNSLYIRVIGEPEDYTSVINGEVQTYEEPKMLNPFNNWTKQIEKHFKEKEEFLKINPN